MRYWISLVNTTEVDQFIEIAKKAEELGFEGITVPDHLIYPTSIEAKYPYTEDGDVWWPDTNPWPDPWVTLTAMGVATTRLKMATNIYLAALRDPFTVARATSAAAIFTNNRVRCGVSAGWVKEEFEALGLDFQSRGRRLDEVIACMHQLHSGEEVAHKGEFFDYSNVIMSPAPPQKVPVWVGGASKPALRRAARNDGWLGVPRDNKGITEIVNAIMDYRREYDLYDQPFDMILSPMELIDKAFIESLDPGANYQASVLPWTPSPWGRAFWVEEGEDHTALEVKFKAMERYRDMMHGFGMWDD